MEEQGYAGKYRVGVVICGRIKTCFMFPYTPVFTISLVLGKQEKRELNHQQTFTPCQVLPPPPPPPPSVRTIQFVTMS